jgi:hypothetical protein
MASIRIDDLSGFNLFNDSESFMRDLQEDDLNIQGGLTPTLALASSEACGVIIAYIIIKLFD